MKQDVDILLVEDNVHDAELAIHVLKKNNLASKLVHLKDGSEAIDFIFGLGSFTDRNVQNVPKVILLDLKMPKVNGIEVLKRLKADDRSMKIPVVIFTSSNEDPDIQACYAFGANSYIIKPVGFDKFVKAVSEVGLYWTILNQQSV